MTTMLIPINSAEKENPTVNARDLHAFLEVKTRFNDWITNRIASFNFTEGQDFVLLTEKLVSGNNAISKVYYLTLNMGKKLAMIERGPRGEQARDYFLECERRLDESNNALRAPQSMIEALRLALAQAEKLEEQQKQLEAQSPMVQFVERVMETNDAMLMETAVKAAKLPYGRNKMFQKLREDGIFMSIGEDRHNVPYQRYIDQGLFTVKITYREDDNGQIHPNRPTPLVTQKGLQWMIKNYGNKEELASA